MQIPQKWIFPPHFVLLSTERERRRKTDRHYHIITEWIFLQTNTSVSRQIETNTKSILQDTFYKDASFPETHSPNCITLWKLQGSFVCGSMELSFSKPKPGNDTDWQVQIFGGGSTAAVAVLKTFTPCFMYWHLLLHWDLYLQKVKNKEDACRAFLMSA